MSRATRKLSSSDLNTGVGVYSLAKDESNQEKYPDAEKLFNKAALIFEEKGIKIWASKSFACAAWNSIPLKDFESAGKYLKKSGQLDQCHGAEGYLNAIYLCLYFEKIKRKEGNDSDASLFLFHAKEYLLPAINLIYEWCNFSSSKLKKHLRFVNVELLNFIDDLINEFFSKKIKQEKKLIPDWVNSNKIRQANITEHFSSNPFNLGETLEKAKLERFSRTAHALKIFQSALRKENIDDITREAKEGTKYLSQELSSLPNILQLKDSIERSNAINIKDIKRIIKRVVNSVEDIQHIKFGSMLSANYTEILQKDLIKLIQNKFNSYKIRNISINMINIVLCFLIFCICILLIPYDIWADVGIAASISGFFLYYIDKFFPFQIEK
ncbi:MAG: hypothetical protein C4522_12570 [Desulfobacteraceae bacterium]|nr:MAG: hypothetical protein C4522_12570 [Desulfobacteraceae bacterium]